MEEHGILSSRSAHRLVPIADIVPPTVFFVIAFCLSTFRIYVRLRYFSLGWDDWLILVAMICGIGSYITGMISVAHGLGTHSYELPEWEVSLNARLSLFKSEFYVWSVTSIKLSVAFMLIRIRGESKLWSRGLIAIMIVLVSLAITCSVIDYTHCRPVRALWDFSYPRSTCDPPSFIRIWQIPTSFIFMTTDVILALLPLLFIRHLQRPLREKVVICLLMGLGLLCATTVIPRLIQLLQNINSNDWTYTQSSIYMWSALEIYLGIIAACVPVLKSVFEATLKKLGILGSADTTLGPWSKSRFWYMHTGVETGVSTENRDGRRRSLEEHFGLSSRAFATRSADMSWIQLEGKSTGQDSPKGSINQSEFDSTKQLGSNKIAKKVVVTTEIDHVQPL